MTRTHTGSCLCKRIQFEVELDANQASMCNCTSCTKLGMRGVIVKPEALRVKTDEATSSVWKTSVGRRFFCPACGVACYARGHLPEVGGDFASININTLDDFDPFTSALTYWDGRHDNWDAGPRTTPWPVFAPSPAS